MSVLHLTTHLNVGGISQYIYSLAKAMQGHLEYVCVVSAGGTYEERFNECGIDTFRIPIKTKNIMSPKVLFSIVPLIAIIKKEKIKLIHAHTRVTQVLAWYVSLITGVPFMTTWHGFYQNKLGRRLMPAYGRRVVAISGPVKDDLINTFKVPEGKIRLIHNSMDIDGFIAQAHEHDVASDREYFGLQGHFPIIGSVARLREDKGQSGLAQAFKLIHEEYPHARLLIVGAGQYEHAFRTLIQELGIRDKVILTGSVDNVARMLNLMDIFVHAPTYIEGFGISAIEAMALKKPIVVSNVGGLVSFVKHEERGMVVEPDDVEGLAACLRTLIADQNKRQQFGAAAYEYCRAHFSISDMADKMKAVYEESL